MEAFCTVVNCNSLEKSINYHYGFLHKFIYMDALGRGDWLSYFLVLCSKRLPVLLNMFSDL